MAGKIPRSFIDDLLNRTDIVDIINTRVPLKKAGKDFQACCPFHNEKTPSFTVSQNKQFFHCFGCGAHGSAIGFLMDFDNMSFVEVIEELASREGIDVPREDSDTPAAPDNRPLYNALEQAANFYQTQLRQHKDANQAVEYLKNRGLSGQIAATFGIGFAPPGWDNLMSQQGTDSKALSQLQLAGMLSKNDAGREYDRFRHRIMFPIRDHRGRTIGFGGRILDDSKPKYLNSPETPAFHKGKELYGLYEARKALRKLDRVIVVEGYMDVVALAQFGILYAVATLGTATTQEHLERLFRATPEVIFCFDGDRAGRDAAWKALQLTLPLMRDGRSARFLLLPDGEDPDTLIRKEGTETFEARVTDSAPLSDFLFGQLESQVDMDSEEGRARLAELAKPMLDKLSPGVFKTMMQQRLAKIIGLKQNLFTNKRQATPAPRRRAQESRKTTPPARQAITLLLKDPQLANLPDMPHNWRKLDIPGIKLLTDLLDLIQNQPTLKTSQIIERWRDQEAFPHLQKLWQASAGLIVPEGGESSEFIGSLKALDQQYYKQEKDRLYAKAKQSPRNLSDADRELLRKLTTQQKL